MTPFRQAQSTWGGPGGKIGLPVECAVGNALAAHGLRGRAQDAVQEEVGERMGWAEAATDADKIGEAEGQPSNQ